jgi:alkylated DNA repair dioxygenase AlkB
MTTIGNPSARSCVAAPLSNVSPISIQNLIAMGTDKTLCCGSGDSFLIERFIGQDEADRVLSSIDASITYLSRQDPRMQFKLYGKTLALPRDKAVCGEIEYDQEKLLRIEPFYKYAVDTPPVEDWKGTILEEMKSVIDERSGQCCNHVVVNQYRSGIDYIGFHHDKSKSFVEGSSVLTVSLGSSRILRLKKVKGDNQGEVRDYILNHGSLFVLGPKTNIEWKHSIVKRPNHIGRRVSMTYRSIAARRSQPL